MSVPYNIEEFERELASARNYRRDQLFTNFAGPEQLGSYEPRAEYDARIAAREAACAREARMRERLTAEPIATLDALQIGTEDERAIMSRLLFDARVAISRLAAQAPAAESPLTREPS